MVLQVCVCVCVPVSLLACPPTYPPPYLPPHPPPTYLAAYLPTFLSLLHSAYLPSDLSVCLSVSVCFSSCLSTCIVPSPLIPTCHLPHLLTSDLLTHTQGHLRNYLLNLHQESVIVLNIARLLITQRDFLFLFFFYLETSVGETGGLQTPP